MNSSPPWRASMRRRAARALPARRVGAAHRGVSRSRRSAAARRRRAWPSVSLMRLKSSRSMNSTAAPCVGAGRAPQVRGHGGAEVLAVREAGQRIEVGEAVHVRLREALGGERLRELADLVRMERLLHEEQPVGAASTAASSVPGSRSAEAAQTTMSTSGSMRRISRAADRSSAVGGMAAGRGTRCRSASRGRPRAARRRRPRGRRARIRPRSARRRERVAIGGERIAGSAVDDRGRGWRPGRRTWRAGHAGRTAAVRTERWFPGSRCVDVSSATGPWAPATACSVGGCTPPERGLSHRGARGWRRRRRPSACDRRHAVPAASCGRCRHATRLRPAAARR